MRWVDRALTKPSRCAVIPSIAGTHPDGFIDTGSEMPGKGDRWDDHVYVSVVALREMVRLMGWPTVEEHSEMVGEIDGLRSELAETQAALERAETVLDSIDALESADFRARRKTGRPKKEVVV